MAQGFTFIEAQKRFIDANRTDIELCEDGYNGWNKQCKFYDKIAQEYFYANARQIYRSGNSPLRHKKIISLDEAKNKFKDRNDIIFCFEEYQGWSKQCKFYDLVQKEYFFSKPITVFRQKTSHPKRRFEKLKETIQKKYNIDNVSKLDFVKNKKIETCMKNYGVENPMLIEGMQDKIKNIFIEKYNGYPTQNEVIKEKVKKTCMKNYGVEYPAKSFIIQERMKSSIQKKYGVDNFSQTNGHKNSLSTRFIKESKEPLIDWYKKQPTPKPAYCTIQQNFPNGEIDLLELELFFTNYKDNKTSLETLGEKLFNSKHYNCKIPGVDLLYRPDFKLSDTTYVNVDGLYWHSEDKKGKQYHFEMRKKYESCNIRIFQFYENEIRDKPLIVKSIVNNNIHNNIKRLYARKCIIKSVTQSTANDFLESNHLMGKAMAKHVGLYDINGQLLCLMSYKEKGDVCKIERFCSLTEHTIIGGFSKLLVFIEKHKIKHTTKEIHNWVDLRYGTGIHLLSKDFKLQRETQGWKWTDGNNLFNRLKCRANMDNRKLSEKEHANELGWYKLYDAGQRLYTKKLT